MVHGYMGLCAMTDRAYTIGGVPDWSLVTDYCRDGLRLYIERGIPPGHFLTAVICNDLAEAVGRADLTNQKNLHNYVKFLYNYAPTGCWRSKENYKAWIEQGGLDGKDASRIQPNQGQA